MQPIKVKLKARTVPVNQEDGRTLEELIAHVARVSNPTNQNNHLTAPKLIAYLQKHNHWSPFEMANILLEIKCPRDIGRQFLRHRSFSFQEFSQRYAATETTSDFREARMQDHKNRQNSIMTDDEDLKKWWDEAQQEVVDLAFTKYDTATKKGIALEQARAILPEGLTDTTIYVNGNVRSYMHYLAIRTGVETQKEHRDIALQMAKAIEPEFPSITKFITLA